VKKFGNIRLSHNINRESACTKQVTGTRIVTKEVPIDPDYEAPPVATKFVDVEEDITEWVCPPEWR